MCLGKNKIYVDGVSEDKEEGWRGICSEDIMLTEEWKRMRGDEELN